MLDFSPPKSRGIRRRSCSPNKMRRVSTTPLRTVRPQSAASRTRSKLNDLGSAPSPRGCSDYEKNFACFANELIVGRTRRENEQKAKEMQDFDHARTKSLQNMYSALRSPRKSMLTKKESAADIPRRKKNQTFAKHTVASSRKVNLKLDPSVTRGRRATLAKQLVKVPSLDDEDYEEFEIPSRVRKFFQMYSKPMPADKDPTRCVSKRVQYRGLNPIEFSEALCQVLQFTDVGWASRAFNVFNRSCTVRISLEDFAEGVRKIEHGIDEEKLAIVFGLYDTDGSGHIDFNEIFSVLHRDTTDMWQEVVFVNKIFSRGDDDMDGSMDFAEFQSLCEDIPLLFKSFSRTLPIKLQNHENMVKIDMSLESLCHLWYRGIQASSFSDGDLDRHGTVDFQGIQSVLAILFKLPPSKCLDKAFTQKIFKLFDNDSTGSVDFYEFLCGISRFLYGSIEDRAACYHNILDTDNGGTITADEIASLLELRHRNLIMEAVPCTTIAANDRRVSSIMSVIDTDGDGNVTETEFVQTMAKRPSILSSLESFLFEGNEPSNPTKYSAEWFRNFGNKDQKTEVDELVLQELI